MKTFVKSFLKTFVKSFLKSFLKSVLKTILKIFKNLLENLGNFENLLGNLKNLLVSFSSFPRQLSLMTVFSQVSLQPSGRGDHVWTCGPRLVPSKYVVTGIPLKTSPSHFLFWFCTDGFILLPSKSGTHTHSLSWQTRTSFTGDIISVSSLFSLAEVENPTMHCSCSTASLRTSCCGPARLEESSWMRSEDQDQGHDHDHDQ